MSKVQKEFRSFEWDEAKRRSNVQKHGVDFPRALEALKCPHLEFASDRNDEMRTLAICPDTLSVLAVVYTMRGENCRIISARIASKHEQRAYRQVFG